MGKKWLFSIGNGAEFGPLEIGRKSSEYVNCSAGMPRNVKPDQMAPSDLAALN